MKPTHVVFDIGGVLIEWQPHLAWIEQLGSEAAARAFLERTDFSARNMRADAGERFSDMAQELDAAEDRAIFADYVTHYGRTMPDAIEGSWDILDRLKAQGTPVHAITNWSAETWPEGVKAHPRLGHAFQTLVVSGQEKIMKPDAQIFGILCERADVVPQECVFIDDGPRNVEGAKAVGMDAIHFTGPPALEAALAERGLL